MLTIARDRIDSARGAAKTAPMNSRGYPWPRAGRPRCPAGARPRRRSGRRAPAGARQDRPGCAIGPRPGFRVRARGRPPTQPAGALARAGTATRTSKSVKVASALSCSGIRAAISGERPPIANTSASATSQSRRAAYSQASRARARRAAARRSPCRTSCRGMDSRAAWPAPSQRTGPRSAASRTRDDRGAGEIARLRSRGSAPP